MLYLIPDKKITLQTHGAYLMKNKDVDNIHYVTDYVRDVYEGMYGETNGEVISNGVNEIFKPSGSQQQNNPLNKSPNNVINILYTGRYFKNRLVDRSPEKTCLI